MSNYRATIILGNISFVENHDGTAKTAIIHQIIRVIPDLAMFDAKDIAEKLISSSGDDSYVIPEMYEGQIVVESKGQPYSINFGNIEDDGDTIDFEATLAELDEKAKQGQDHDPNYVIALLDSESNVGNAQYAVRVPAYFNVEDSADELITRCDNREWDLRVPVGQKNHFGGRVDVTNDPQVYYVTVYID